MRSDSCERTMGGREVGVRWLERAELAGGAAWKETLPLSESLQLLSGKDCLLRWRVGGDLGGI